MNLQRDHHKIGCLQFTNHLWVEISCINIKPKKKWTWWENEPLQSKSKSAEQTKKDRNFSLPPITAHIFWSFPNGFSGANHLFSNWNFRFSHVNGVVLLAYYFAEMVTLGATFIGSLTIYDDNNKENVQKDKLIFSLLPDNDVKRPNMTFYGGREHTSTRNRFFFHSKLGCRSKRNQCHEENSPPFNKLSQTK